MNYFTSPFVPHPHHVTMKSPHPDEHQYEMVKTTSGGGNHGGDQAVINGGPVLTRCCDQAYDIYDSPFGFFHYLTYQHTRQLIRQRRYETHLSPNNYERQELPMKKHAYRTTELDLLTQSSAQKSHTSFGTDDNSPAYEDVLSKTRNKLSKSQTVRQSTTAHQNHHQLKHQQQHMLLVPNPFFPLFGTSGNQARQRNRTFTSKKSFQNSIVNPNIAQPEFTLKEFDLVLYGFMRNTPHKDKKPAREEDCDPAATKIARLHALSGLRVGQLSHGMDRILSGSSASGRNAFFKTDPAVLDLPHGLSIERTSFAGIIHWGIFAKGRHFEPGTQFGPYQGRMINTSEMKSKDDNSLMWEIFFPDGQLSHFVDGRGTHGSWMSFLNCARTPQEQNLAANQKEGSIFYEVIKEVKDGHELLVWYDDKSYFQFLGIPVAPRVVKPGKTNQTAVNNTNLNIDEEALKSLRMENEDSEGYQCERCGKVFAYQYYRDKHLKYTRCVDQGDRKFPCHMCSRSFEKRDRLRIHVLHVHEKHRPHKCLVCSKSFSQSSSLNKHMRVHSGERPYKCVYCSKAFTASSILRTHIRQHSGEKPFKCKHCGKAFASHAAHDSHVRRTHAKVKVICSVCGLQFNEIQDLKIHFRSHDDHLLTTTKELTSSYSHGWEELTNMNINQDEPLDVESFDNETDNYA